MSLSYNGHFRLTLRNLYALSRRCFELTPDILLYIVPLDIIALGVPDPCSRLFGMRIEHK